jgi:VWFA-related protein
MRSLNVIRAVLLLCLALAILIACMPQRANLFAFSPAPAQKAEDTKSPNKKKNPPAPAKDEEDKPEGETAISVDVDLVSLQVLVTDSKGNAITGLKPENFTIYEDNVKQEISHFSPVDANINVAMVVEFSHNIEPFINDVWNAMFSFADSLRKGDWVAVMGYDLNTTIISDFTQDRQKLNQAFKKFMYPTFWDSNLSDALIETIDRTQEIEGKVAILLISTGFDTFSRHTYEEALNKCKASNASIYAIGVGQYARIRAEASGRLSNSTNMDYLMGDNRLRSFADYSGGAAYFPRLPMEFPEIFHNISQLLRNQYSIAYASSNPKKDGKFRKIKVDVAAELTDSKGKPLKYKVSHKRGYIPRGI